jgi:quercetin dioxygenase-like cupin family protein
MKLFKAEAGVTIGALDSMYPSRLTVTAGGTFGAATSTTYGYLLRGGARIEHNGAGYDLNEGAYFSLPGEFEVKSGDLVVLVERIGVRGQVIVGAVEKKGRLSYIDGCSDSMLVYPARLGDPVFNHLHFPKGIVQTQHTHPSIRLGIVARGRGHAWQQADKSHEGWEYELAPGSVFLLEEQEMHSFRTDKAAETMDVIAYHPDSDWGPVDGNHPMLNRTYIGTAPGAARGA